MNLEQKILELERVLIPDSIPRIYIFSNETKQQAIERYEKENNIKVNPEWCVFIIVYPEYYKYDHIQFYYENESKIEQLYKQGLTLDQITKKYFIDKNSIID